MISIIKELFRGNLPLEYYNLIAQDIPRTLSCEDDEFASYAPFTADAKDVINPNRQNIWPCLVKASMPENMKVS